MPDAEATLSLIGADKGLRRVLDAAGKGIEKLSDSAGTANDSFNDWNEGLKTSEKAIVAAGKAATHATRGIFKFGDDTSRAYDKVTDSAQGIIDTSDFLGKTTTRVAAHFLGLGKPLNTVSNLLGPMGDLFGTVADEQTAVGKAAVLLDAAEKPLINSLKIAATIAEGFAKQLETMGAMGEWAAERMLVLSKGLKMIQRAVGIADTAGDIYQLGEATVEFAKEAGPAAVETATMLSGALEKTGAMGQLFGNTTKTVTTLSKGYQAYVNVFKQGQGTILDLTTKNILKFIELGEKVTLINTVASALTNAYMQMQNLNQAFSGLEGMGIDTSFAKLGMSMGFVGEGLLLNKEAAQEFANTATSAFGKLEDQLAYVRTLGSASQNSIASLSKEMQNLVNGPLKNTITSTQASSALYNTMSAGFQSVTQSTQVMSAGLKLASASGADASTTMEALIKSMSAYGIAARDATTTAAKMNSIVENGIVSFPQLAGGYARVASVAKGAGVKIDELNGSLAALTYTMTADDSMTGFASLLNSIAGQGAQSEAAIASLGIKFDLNTIKTKGLVNALQDLYKAAGGSQEKIKEIIPDSLAFTTAWNLMTNASSKAAEYTKASANATAESLDEMFNRRRESMMQRGIALMNGFQEVITEFGQRLMPLMEPGITFLEGVLKTLQNLPGPVKALVGSLVVAKLGFDNLLGVGGSLIGMFTKMAMSMAVARTASLFFSGKLKGEIDVLREMITVRKDYLGVLLRATGIEDMLNKSSQKAAAREAARAASQQAATVATAQATAAKTVQVTVEDAATGRVMAYTTAVNTQTVAQTANKANLLSTIKATLGKAAADAQAAIAQINLTRAVQDNTRASASNAANGLMNGMKGIVPMLKGAWVAMTAYTASIWANTKAGIANAASGFMDGLKNAPKLFGSAIGGMKNWTVNLLSQSKAAAGAAIASELAATKSGLLVKTFTGLKSAGGTAVTVLGSLSGTLLKLGGGILKVAAPLAAIGAAFMVLQDFIPGLGGAASESERLAKELDNVGLSAGELKEKMDKAGESTREYTGFLNNWILGPAKGIFGWFGDMGDRISNLFSGKDIKPGEGLGAKARVLFAGMMDNIQAVIDKPMNEAVGRAIDKMAMTTLQTRWKTEALQTGQFFSREAKNVASAAKEMGRAMTGKEMQDALKADQNAINARKKENDDLISSYEKQAEAIKDPERRAALLAQVEALKQETTAMEEAAKAQQVYINNLNTMRDTILANQAATGQQKTSEFLDNLKTETDKDLPAWAKDASDSIYNSLGDAVGNAQSPAQRRALSQLGGMTKNLFNSFKEIGKPGGPDMNAIRNNIQSVMDGINEAVKEGALSPEEAREVREKLYNQTIQIDSEELGKIQGQLKELFSPDMYKQAQQDSLATMQQSADKQFDIQQTNIERIQTLQTEHQMSQEDAQAELAQQETRRAEMTLDLEMNRLKEMNEGSADYLRQQQVIARAELAIRQKVAAEKDLEFERDQKRQERQIELAMKRQAMPLQAQLGNLDLISRQLQMQQALEQSRFSVTAAIGNLEEVRLQNQSKLTQDAEARAGLETQLAEKRALNLEKNQEQERKMMEFQIKQNKIAAEREVIQNRIAQLENDRAIAQAKVELIRARRSKASTEELDLIEQQIDSLEQQGGELSRMEKTLQDNKKQQTEIAENSRKELQYKQAAAKESAQVDMILAKQNERIVSIQRATERLQILNAAREQQLQGILKITQDASTQAMAERVMAEDRLKLLEQQQAAEEAILQIRDANNVKGLEELRLKNETARAAAEMDLFVARQKEQVAAIQREGEREQIRLDAKTKAYEYHNQLLEAQKSLLSSQSSALEASYQIVMDSARSERERKKLAKELSQIRVATLVRQQAMERQLLETQILQNKAALEREKIQMRIQQAQAKSDVASAMAVKANTEADPKATAEARKAAQMALDAAIEKGAAASFGLLQLDQQGKLQDTMAQYQRIGLYNNQSTDLFKAQYEAANKYDKRQMVEALRQQLPGMTNNLLMPTLQMPTGVGDYDKFKAEYVAKTQAEAAREVEQEKLKRDKERLERLVKGPDAIKPGTTPPVPGVQVQESVAAPGIEKVEKAQDKSTQKMNEVKEAVQDLAGKISMSQNNTFNNYFNNGDAQNGKVKQDVERQLFDALKGVFTETERRLKADG